MDKLSDEDIESAEAILSATTSVEYARSLDATVHAATAGLALAALQQLDRERDNLRTQVRALSAQQDRLWDRLRDAERGRVEGERIAPRPPGAATTPIHGPEKCPHTCSECEGLHHFLWISAEFDDQERPEHENPEPAHLDLPYWYQCKHCDAWVAEVYDDEEEDEGDDGDDEDDDGREWGHVVYADGAIAAVVADDGVAIVDDHNFVFRTGTYPDEHGPIEIAEAINRAHRLRYDAALERYEKLTREIHEELATLACVMLNRAHGCRGCSLGRVALWVDEYNLDYACDEHRRPDKTYAPVVDAPTLRDCEAFAWKGFIRDEAARHAKGT